MINSLLERMTQVGPAERNFELGAVFSGVLCGLQKRLWLRGSSCGLLEVSLGYWMAPSYSGISRVHGRPPICSLATDSSLVLSSL